MSKPTHKLFDITPKHDEDMEVYVNLPVETKEEVIEDMRRVVGEGDYTVTSAALDWDDDSKKYDIEIKGYEKENAHVWYEGDEFDD